jgi:hypothetical protein
MIWPRARAASHSRTCEYKCGLRASITKRIEHP